jgi:ribosomal protein S27E
MFVPSLLAGLKENAMQNLPSRSVTVLCSTCGGSSFEFDEGEAPAKCIGCNRVFTLDELREENAPVIEAHVEDMKPEIMAAVAKELQRRFRKFK